MAKPETEYIIPETVTTISDSAFYNSSLLTSVTIGDKITTIDRAAFGSCSSLTTVTIKNKLFESFGEEVFWGCSSLTTIYYYGNKEPSWSTETNCYDIHIPCGVASSTLICSPFSCETPDTIKLYVTQTYKGSETTFCDNRSSQSHLLFLK